MLKGLTMLFFLTGQAGKIISAVMEAGFEVSMIEMFHMDKANAERADYVILSHRSSRENHQCCYGGRLQGLYDRIVPHGQSQC